MQIFHHRPMALAACFYALFALLATKLTNTSHLLLLLLAFALFLALLLVFWIKKRAGRRGIVALLCVGAVLLSLGTSYCFFKIRYAGLQSYVGTPCRVRGQVIERLCGEAYYSRFRVQIDQINEDEESFGALLECDYPSPLQNGDCFQAEIVPRAFESDEFFDEESYSLSDGCMLVLVSQEGDSCTILPSDDIPLSVWASNLNLKLSYDLYGETGGGLTSRLLLGNDRFFSDLDELRFSYTGISHLLALSGLHVSILIGAIELLLRRLRVPRVARAILIPLAAIGYLILTGCSVSAMRAVLMVCILYLAYLWKGDYDPFTALSLALFLILQGTPYAVYDLSLWLSFLAAGSIIIFMPAIRKMTDRWREKTHLPKPVFRLFRALFSAISVGVIANIALLPLSAFFFGEISVWSIPVTLLFSIPVSVLLILGAILLLFPSFPYLGEACGAIEEWMLDVVEALSEMGHGLLPLQDVRCTAVILILAAVLILLAVLRVKRWRWSLSVPLLCVAVVISSFAGVHAPERQGWKTTTLEVSSGKVLIRTKEGRAVVVNDAEGTLNLSYEIKKTVNAQMCTEIESLVLCEIDPQAPYFLSKLSTKIFVRELHLPKPRNIQQTAIAERICIDAERYGIPVFYDAEEQLPALKS